MRPPLGSRSSFRTNRPLMSMTTSRRPARQRGGGRIPKTDQKELSENAAPTDLFPTERLDTCPRAFAAQEPRRPAPQRSMEFPLQRAAQPLPAEHAVHAA